MGSLFTTGTAVVIVAGIVGLTRITIVWLALRGTKPRDRPAILRAVAGLWAEKWIELHASHRKPVPVSSVEMPRSSGQEKPGRWD